jgi:uncharacterized protein YndB with AHSA1/START domain
MPHEFEIASELEVDATPEQVWEAVSTGPGWDSWFMGRNEIEPGEGGAVRWSIGGFTATSTVATWDPPKRFVSKGDVGPDGSLHQFDYQIEPREGGGSSIKYVHSGFLGGDDWETEYAAMNEGDPMYFQKLVEYVTYFSGRFATPIDAHGPNVPDRDHAFAAMRAGLGLSDDVAEGDRVRLTPDGFAPIEGVVDCVSPSFLGVRSSDALYRFIYGFDGSVMIGHHLFAAGVDQRQVEKDWAAWLDRLFEVASNPTGSN